MTVAEVLGPELLIVLAFLAIVAVVVVVVRVLVARNRRKTAGRPPGWPGP